MELGGLTWNLADLVLLLILIGALVRGFTRGAVSQLGAFGGAAAGLFGGASIGPVVAGQFVNRPGPSLALLTLLVLIVCIGLGQAVGMAVGVRIAHAVERAGIGVLDRILGMAVGVAGIVVLVWLFGSVLAHGPIPFMAQQVQQSQVVNQLDRALPPAPDVFGQVATYLDQQGFPQVVTGMGSGGIVTTPPPEAADDAVTAASEAGEASTVQIQALGCNAVSSGSGFVTSEGFVVTNAHVIAGAETVDVRDAGGMHQAVPIHFDPVLDLAVLSAPSLTAPAIAWSDAPADHGTDGATLGFPGGMQEMQIKAASVGARATVVGRDIYGRGNSEREVLALASPVRQGDSGGPFVTSDGTVGGVVFAADPADRNSGYALTAERVAGDVDQAIAANEQIETGACRF